LKRKLTAEQRKQIRAYVEIGYTACIIDEQGRVVPAYSDWVIEYILDELDIHEAFRTI